MKRHLHTIAVMAVALMFSSTAKADDNFCLKEMAEQSTSNALAISMLGAKVLKAVDSEVADLFANPDGDRVNALADAIAKSVETVTKRKAGPIVHGYALMQVKHVILEAALANKKQIATVEGLFDDEERLLLAQETNSRNALILARAVSAVVNAALTSCNRPNDQEART